MKLVQLVRKVLRVQVLPVCLAVLVQLAQLVFKALLVQVLLVLKVYLLLAQLDTQARRAQLVQLQLVQLVLQA